MDPASHGHRLQAITAALADAIASARQPIVAAYLFGSTARREAGPMSDVDVGVLYDAELDPNACVVSAAALHTTLERSSSRPVQIVILNDASPVLRHRVLRDGVVLAGADDPRRVHFEAGTLCEYLDLQPMIERYDRALIERAKAGRLGA